MGPTKRFPNFKNKLLPGRGRPSKVRSKSSKSLLSKFKLFQQRMYYDSMIRYNYYIDNMPMQDLNELDSEQKKRLESTCRTKKLDSEVVNFKLKDITGMLQEVNNDYTRTMNKIIFDKFLEDNDTTNIFPE